MDNVTKKINGFEDLDAWKTSIDLAVLTYNLTKKYPREELFGITSQMRRASSSISANIAEGCGRYNRKEKNQFYKIANGSLLELKSFYYLSCKLNYLNEEQLDTTIVLITDCQKLISGLIKSVANYEK